MTGGPALVRQRHDSGAQRAEAVLSACGRYRYSLTLTWQPDRPGLLVVLLNPSVADAFRSDPTLSRCRSRAIDLGFGALRLMNLYALRATDPAALGSAEDPVGPENDACLDETLACWAPKAILCGWGNRGQALGRGAIVRARLAQGDRPLWHLGLTATGAPRHPLYLPAATRPHLWA